MKSFEGTVVSQSTTMRSQQTSSPNPTPPPTTEQSQEFSKASSTVSANSYDSIPQSKSSSHSQGSTVPTLLCRVFVPRIGWGSQVS